MKKQLLILIAALSVGLGACARPAATTPTANGSQNTATTAASNVKVINQDQFAEVVAPFRNVSTFDFRGKRPAVVDFNATWCGPCRKLAPILDELSTVYADRVDFYSIDVDDNTELARTLGVSNIPMLLLCPTGGERPQVITGLVERSVLDGAIREVLLHEPAPVTPDAEP